MSGTDMAWAPYVMGAMQGLGGYLGGGAKGNLTGFSPMGQYGPETQLGGAYDDLMRLGAANAQYAASPVTLPGARIPILPMYKGGGMPIDVFATGMDPAWTRPELLWRPGVDWGSGGQAGQTTVPFFRGAGTAVHQSASQGLGYDPEDPTAQYAHRMPDIGGGLQQMEDALGLLGVQKNQFGQMMFSGARGLTNLARQGTTGTGPPTPDDTGLGEVDEGGETDSGGTSGQP